MTEEDQEVQERKLMKKYAEEALKRESKPRIPWNYNCSVKIMKFQVKKESLIKQVTCQKCVKTYKLTEIQNYVSIVKKNNTHDLLNNNSLKF